MPFDKNIQKQREEITTQPKILLKKSLQCDKVPFIVHKTLKNQDKFRDIEQHEENKNSLNDILNKFTIQMPDESHKEAKLILQAYFTTLPLDIFNLIYHKFEFTEQLKQEIHDMVQTIFNLQHTKQETRSLLNIWSPHMIDHMSRVLKIENIEQLIQSRSYLYLILTSLIFGCALNSDISLLIDKDYNLKMFEFSY
ncbi:hypothetical protein AB837_00406 [bacterium AB1]|nr:hypothetical protein AB837_00406 [bacterium AB1]